MHLSGTIIGVYLFYKVDFKLRKAIPTIVGTWVLYLVARILCEPWPYWATNGNAYFSTNQINDMPFYFYGLEYSIVVAVLLAINYAIMRLDSMMPNRKLKGLLPIFVYVVVCALLQIFGLIRIQDIPIAAFGVRA